MKNKMTIRIANGIFLAAVLLLGAAACNKQSLAPANGGQKIITSLTVGTPPPFIAWLQGPDVPEEADAVPSFLGRVAPFGFAIGAKGYIGSGDLETSQHTAEFEKPGKDLWEYDTITKTWTQKADWPGVAHTSMASFVIGGNAYVCTGSGFPGEPSGVISKEVWQYNQAANIWTRKGDFPGAARSGPVAAALNGKGYLGTGSTAGTDGKKDWWQYDPTSDAWTQKSSLPGPARTGAFSFAPPAANGLIYVCAGDRETANGTNFFNDLWAYDPASDSWAQKADLPAAGRSAGVSMSLPAQGIVATGNDDTNNPVFASFNDCWMYSPATGNWSQLPNVGGGVRFNAGGFCIGKRLFVAAGQNSGFKTDFWSLDLN
jgi:N-acetylneuraminic acid mutarotase